LKKMKPEFPPCDCGVSPGAKFCYTDCSYYIAVWKSPGYAMLGLERGVIPMREIITRSPISAVMWEHALITVCSDGSVWEFDGFHWSELPAIPGSIREEQKN